jgi:hypothetical protein
LTDLQIKANNLNSKFDQELKKYEYKKEFKEKLRKVVMDGSENVMSTVAGQSALPGKEQVSRPGSFFHENVTLCILFMNYKLAMNLDMLS